MVSCTAAPAAGVFASQPFYLSNAMSEADKSRRLATALTGIVAQSPVKIARRQLTPRLVLADGLARYWMMTPPAEVGSLAELVAVAQARCEQLFGSAQRWRIAGAWNARHPFLCMAIPDWIAQTVATVFGAECRLDGALLLALDRCASRLPAAGWACMTFPGCSSLLGIAKGRLCSLRTLSLDATASLETQLERAARELHREGVRTQMPLDTPVWWCQLGDASTAVSSTKEVLVDGLCFVPAPPPWASTFMSTRMTGPLTDAEAAAALAVQF